MSPKNIVIFVVMLLALTAFGYFLMAEGDSLNDSQNSDVIGEQNENKDKDKSEPKDYLSFINLEDSPSLGDKDAPVIMVNYSSYYCPFCSRFKAQIFPELKEKYIDTGKVLYIYKDAGSPEDSVFLAAHCAGAEDRFWDYQDLLIKKGVRSEQDLYAYAQELDLDTEKFEECLTEGCCSYIIEQTQKEMAVLEIESIPYFIINEAAVSGLESIEGFFEIIDEELAKKGEN